MANSKTKNSRSKVARKPRSGRRRQGPSRRSARPTRGRTGVAGQRKDKGLGGNHVEGRQAVRELLIAGGRPVHEIFIEQGVEPSDIIVDINVLAEQLGVSVSVVTRTKLDSVAQTSSHQGVVARAADLKEHSLDDLLAHPSPFLVVLDRITDPRNLGAILRVAECAGVTGVVIGRHRSVHVTPTVTKTAAGAIEYLPIALVGGIPAGLSELHDADVLTVGLDAAGERSIYETDLRNGGNVALVLGAEGKGLSRLVKQRVNLLASLPLVGQLGSLNVGTAAAVACYEVVRRRVKLTTEMA